jgi:hypothetical protein
VLALLERAGQNFFPAAETLVDEEITDENEDGDEDKGPWRENDTPRLRHQNGGH